MLGVLRGELDRGHTKASALSSAVRDLASGKHSARQQQQREREREREERERDVLLVDEERAAGQRAAGQRGRQGQGQGQQEGQQGAGAKEVLLHPRLLTDVLLMAQPPGEVCEACGREHGSSDSVSARMGAIIVYSTYRIHVVLCALMRLRLCVKRGARLLRQREWVWVMLGPWGHVWMCTEKTMGAHDTLVGVGAGGRLDRGKDCWYWGDGVLGCR